MTNKHIGACPRMPFGPEIAIFEQAPNQLPILQHEE